MPQTIPFDVQEIAEAVVFTVGTESPIDLATEQVPQTILFDVQEITEAVTFTVGSESPIDLATEQVRIIYDGLPAYTGSYTVIPSESAQILATNAKRMTEDVTIAAIPQNYGLITWNGSYLTVS